MGLLCCKLQMFLFRSPRLPLVKVHAFLERFLNLELNLTPLLMIYTLKRCTCARTTS